MATRSWRALVVVGAALMTGLATAAPVSAAATVTVGSWNFNEGPGATVADDSSAYDLDGRVGADISTGVRYDGATAYRFPTWASNAAGHEVVVPDNSRLDPGTSDYAVSVRFRTARYYSNVVQKGQSGTVGGYWKMEVARGVVKCQFRTSTGSHLTVGSTRRIDDGRWHSVRCGRDGGTVSLYLDGTRHSLRTGLSGSISNSWELAIGGKSRCGTADVDCDFFAGDVDYVRIQKG